MKSGANVVCYSTAQIQGAGRLSVYRLFLMGMKASSGNVRFAKTIPMRCSLCVLPDCAIGTHYGDVRIYSRSVDA